MKLRRRFALIGLACLSAATAISPAFAAPFKDSDGNIHFQDSLTPGQKVTYEAGGLERKVTANYCGLLIISVPSNAPMPASISVDGAAVDTTSLPVQSVPSCTNNVLKEPRPANFKDANGRVVLVGKTPGVQSPVIYTGVPSLKSLTANGCGYARIGNSTAYPAPMNFTYGGQSYTTASLPVSIPNKCITINGSPVKFVYTP
ncbi:MAG: hypothetical protein NW224_12050 [Leptolyngbyaceae cyanobacterium bins.302]|nr:hypothetical protein [Leptolyngbyaceae cyanobacterium bins.302]